jgi:hypothetical protein
VALARVIRRQLVVIGTTLVVGLAMVPAIDGGMPVAAQAPVETRLALPDDGALTSDLLVEPPLPPPVNPATIDLDSVIADALVEATAMPAAEWDVAALASALDYDPMRAFVFVRDRIAFDPYAGVLRGAEGTLAARAGNAWDRALLLGALLDEMLVPRRFARAPLDAATAGLVLARAFAPVTDPLASPGLELTPMIDAQALAVRGRRDHARIRAALGDRVDAMGSDARAAALAAVGDHVWVQALIGPSWVDLDPTLPDATAGSVVAPAATSFADVAPEDRQALSIRLDADLLGDDGLMETRKILEHSFDSAEDAAREVFLYFQPDVEGIGGSILTALSGDEEWAPVLLVDGEGTKGEPFPAGGRGTDVFGEEVDQPSLAAMRLTVTRTAPGLAPEQTVRTLFDRVPLERADPTAPLLPAELLPMIVDAAGPLPLAQVHHLAISTGGADARAYVYGRGGAADFISGVVLDEEAAGDYSFADFLWPVVVADQAVVIASERGIVPALEDREGIRAFVGAPRLYLMSFGPGSADGSILSAETDLLLDGVTVLAQDPADVSAVARRQLWYGVLQTALETQLGLMRAAGLGGDGSDLLGASLASGPLTVLEPGLVGTTPDGLGTGLAATLAAGRIALVPGDPAASPVWWAVDPVRGTVRSVLDPNLGGIRATGPPSGTVPARRADTVAGKHQGTGAGSRAFRDKLPGANRNDWGGNRGQWSPARHMPLPNGCKPGQEYIAIVGCVSVPAAQAIRMTVGVAVSVVAAIAVSWLAFG